MIKILFLATILIHNYFHGVSAQYGPKPIVGGTEATPGRYPFQVALVESSGGQYCGGSLVDEYWVLSAAHCKGIGSKVQIGRHDLSENSEIYEEIDIEWETAHPYYNDYTMDNDFMMIKLANASTAETVTLDDGNQTLNDGDAVTVMGWGTTTYGGVVSDVLLEVEVDIVGASDCGNVYTPMTDSMLCAASEGKDSCQGDSGGPLIVKGVNASTDFQVGVVSYGQGCACSDYPGVYARVSEQIVWIQEQIINGTDPDDKHFVPVKPGKGYGHKTEVTPSNVIMNILGRRNKNHLRA